MVNQMIQSVPVPRISIDLDAEREIIQAICGEHLQALDSVFNDPELSRYRLSPNLFQNKPGERPGLFDFYPYLFCETFPAVSPSQRRQLTVAIQLLFAHLLIQDRLMDAEAVVCSLVHGYQQLTSSLLHEKSWRLLADLLTVHSPFWRLWDQYHQEWLVATWTEKRWDARWPQRPDTTTLLDIAANKTAIAKVVPAALAVLSEMSAPPPALDESQTLAATAFQLYDDLLDWRQDYERKHLTFPTCRALVNAGISPGMEILPADELGHHLYFTDAADVTLRKAHDYYTQALAVLADLPAPRWRQRLETLQAANWRLRADLSELKEQQLLEQRRRSLAPQLRDQAFKPRLAQAIEAAIQFLIVSQTPEGYWQDLRLDSGSSTEYMTGYVGQSLCGASVGNTAVAKAVAWLVACQHADGGWGWHAGFTSDTDSTVNALLFLHGAGQHGSKAFPQGVNYLLDNQIGNGGIRSYHPRDVGEQCVGWCSPANTITALVIQLLHRLGYEPTNSPLARLITYLNQQQEPAGMWHAYWWRGEMMSTSQAAIALSQVQGFSSTVAQAWQWLQSGQQPDGGWGYTVGETAAQPINTALGLRALLQAEATAKATQRAAEWLLAAQDPDGGWPSCPILRFPRPEVLAPWADLDSPEMEPGSRRDDNNRLFTTATVVQALRAYQAAYARPGV